ncbi:hypothetical protein HN51_043827 [Arachis hypogaea]|nr:oligopeptide transporter 6 [Arachis hypogaea]
MNEFLEEIPIKQVDVTVSKTDDPTLPILTFRMWFLGIISCVALALANQFFWYRTQPLSVTPICVQIAVVPIGHLMARILPTRRLFQGTMFEFTMNPGPFNVKEHVLITIFANAGAGSVYATHILTAVKIYFKKSLPFIPAFIVMLTTQVLGFGWAGLFRKHLVEPAEMWWPANMVQVSLFRALHDKEKRPKHGTTRNQFFLIAMATGFAYYVLPDYLFNTLSTMSWVCWLGSKSVLVNQLGSGMHGLGLGSFGLDWTSISSYLQSPLVSPFFATCNVAVGFFLIMYVMTPICYWNNVYSAKNFPIFSSGLFMKNGTKYDVSKIVNSKFHLDTVAYSEIGNLHLSTFFTMTYGIGFATLSATVMHVLLFHGRDIWKYSKKAFGSNKKMDIHTKLMKNYKSVPMWWFLVIAVLNLALILFACQYYNEALQLPWWGVLLACAISLIFTLPIGIISATTNQTPGLNIITEYIIGYMYPERPVANMCFKVFGYISMMQALSFVQDFKLGHYMKIPPRMMFMAQVLGTLIAVVVYTLAAWWMMEKIPHLCDVSKLPADSPWTCPMDTVFYDASVIWGLIGPRRIFGNLGEYAKVNWFFLGGAILPLLAWIAHKAFPGVKWIGQIHFPVLLGATAMMPPASSLNFNSWLILAFLSGFVVYRYKPEWWSRYNYVLSGALDAGTAFMAMFSFFLLGSTQISWWGNSGEGCPLATCPTAPGIAVGNCPVH